MATKLTAASIKRLEGVHPHLVAVVKRAAEITRQPFQITEGLRTLSRQRELVRRGASRTLRSRHLKAPNGLGHAIDVVAMIGGRISWEVPLYHVIADAMRQAATQLGIRIEWGGDWVEFFDGPHFQLPWDTYPGVGAVTDPAPPQPATAEFATLVPGSHGEGVTALQNNLVRLGYPLKADGQFGPRTRAALSSALAKIGLKATDVVTASVQARIAKAARAAERSSQ